MWADLGVIVSAVLAVAALLGLLVKYVLMPYLIEQVVRPLRETHRQVTPHHRLRRDEPTVVDRLDDVKTDLSGIKEAVEDLSKKARENRRLALAAGGAADLVGRRLSDHEAWSREEDSRLWSAITKHQPERQQHDERGNQGST